MFGRKSLGSNRFIVVEIGKRGPAAEGKSPLGTDVNTLLGVLIRVRELPTVVVEMDANPETAMGMGRSEAMALLATTSHLFAEMFKKARAFLNIQKRALKESCFVPGTQLDCPGIRTLWALTPLGQFLSEFGLS